MNIVAHNLLAMNAQRQFGINTKNKVKSMEKLSSGYKINRAADDAAGLAISEKMRRQIRGLNQGAENIQDGISLCQVADGALNETQEILQRMNELAVKAANGTNTSEDRGYIQSEIDQLITEVDRIAEGTSFNEEIYPLRGGNDVSQSSIKLLSQVEEYNLTVINGSTSDCTVDGVTLVAGQSTVSKALHFKGTDEILIATKGGCGTLLPYGSRTVTLLGGSFEGLGLSDLQIETDGRVYFEHNGRKEYLSYIVTSDGTGVDVPMLSHEPYRYSDLGAHGYVSLEWIYDPTFIANMGVSTEKGDCWIQMGAEAGQGMYINFVDATAAGIGVSQTDVSTQDNAEAAIATIKKAIYKVSEYRSNFGAQQNRLEYGYDANTNTVENTSMAESRIRDTDMAKEMVRYSNINILQQVGQAMMAQANQSNQGVLSLLN